MGGNVKKSETASACRWFRRKASERVERSGSLGALFIQRKMVLSETSKPSMRSSPCIRGAPQLGFSTTIRKINSRTSFGAGLLPTCLRTLEISMRRECFQSDQTAGRLPRRAYRRDRCSGEDVEAEPEEAKHGQDAQQNGGEMTAAMLLISQSPTRFVAEWGIFVFNDTQ